MSDAAWSQPHHDGSAIYASDRARLDATLAVMWAEGQKMTLEQAKAEAVGEPLFAR